MASAAVELDATDDEILREAGSDPSLLKLQGDAAPLELLVEFLRCLMSEEFEAAKLLCQKVLSLEPSNVTAQEFLPSLQERIKLDEELETESSSSDRSSDDDESSGENEDEMSDEEERSSDKDESDTSTRKEDQHHCCHGNHRTQ